MAQEFRLRIEGMHCAACVRRVTAVLGKVSGAEVQKVDVGSAVVRTDSEAGAQAAVDAVNGIGFKATIAPGV